MLFQCNETVYVKKIKFQISEIKRIKHHFRMRLNDKHDYAYTFGGRGHVSQLLYLKYFFFEKKNINKNS